MCECMYLFAQLGAGVYMIVCHCGGRMVNIWLISSLGVRYQTEGEFGGCVQVNWDIHVCTCS